jgi:hypothetical protein
VKYVSLPADQRLGIMDLFARYAWTLDTADPDQFVDLFAEDGTLVISQVRHEGRDGILEYVRELTSRSNWAGTQHYSGQVIIEEASPDRCRVRSYGSIVFRLRDGSSHLRALSLYRDTCVKVGDRWLFSERIGDYWNPDQILEYRLAVMGPR